jgi:hypothetical protein
MFCQHCGAKNGAGVNFCMSCGQSMTNVEVSESAPESSFDAYVAPSQKKKPLVLGLALGAVAIVLTLIIVSIVKNAEDAKYLKPISATSLASSMSAMKVTEAAQARCEAVKASLPADNAIAAMNSRSTILNKYLSGTARKASAFISATSWVSGTETADVQAAVAKALAGGLDEVIARTATIRGSDRAAFATLWEQDFQALALKACGVQDKVNGAISAQAAFEEAKSGLITFAASVPWYPDGFSEWPDDSNIAWKWVNGGTCSLGDWCWHIKVITQTGCPNGIYAELNELDSAGNVIDYSNDTIPRLGPLSTAILEFSTFNTNADKGQMATITCHS